MCLQSTHTNFLDGGEEDENTSMTLITIVASSGADR